MSTTEEPIAPTEAGAPDAREQMSAELGMIGDISETIEEGEEEEESEEEEEEVPSPAAAAPGEAAPTEAATAEGANEADKPKKKKKKKSKGAKFMNKMAQPGVFMAKQAQKGVETMVINPTMAVGKAVGKGVETVVVNPTMAAGKAVGKGVENAVVNPTMAVGKGVGDAARKMAGKEKSSKKKSSKKKSQTSGDATEEKSDDKKDKDKSESSKKSSKDHRKSKSGSKSKSGLSKFTKGLGLDGGVSASEHKALKETNKKLESRVAQLDLEVSDLEEKLDEKEKEIAALREQLKKIGVGNQELTLEEATTPSLSEKRAQKRLMEEKANILMTEGHNSGKLRGLDDSNHSTSSQKGDGSMKIISKAKETELQRKKRMENSKIVHKMRNLSTRNTYFQPQKTNGVAANPLGMGDYEPPVFPKTPEAVQLIHNALRKNVFFDKMNQDDFDRMTPSFEKVLVKNGEHIITQGDKADFFYIVAKGKVIYKVDGKLVGEASKEQSFGELSLLYTSPRAASVIALSNPTELFRIDQRAFRQILQNKAKEFEKEKLELLKAVRAFEGVTDSDLYRLADCMIMRKFKADQVVVRKGDVGNCFYIIHSGTMKVTDIGDGTSANEGVILEPKDYFGERALITDERRSANVSGAEDGACFAIDRVTFEKVLGQFSQVIMRSHDKDMLANIKNIKESKFSDAMIETLSSAIVDITFKAGDAIQEKGVKQQGALFLIREGSVTIEKGGKSTTLKKDEYFGDDQIGKFTPEQVTPDYSATAATDCTCGFLGLKQFPKLSLDGTTKEDDVANTRIMRRRSTIRESFRFRKVELDKMDKLQVLGEGQFGCVHLVKATNVAGETRTGDGGVPDSYALKVQDLAELGGLQFKELIDREQKVMENMRHPFVVDLIHTQIIGTDAYMLMNCITCGELWSVVHTQGDSGEWESGIPEDHARFYAIVIADAMAFMHNAKVVYRDLKPENVMIDKVGYPNIIDFGFAKEIEGKTYTFCGTPNYIAPEIVANMGHSFGVDHWAFGILIYEMISGENPFFYEGMEHAQLLENIANTEAYPITKECSAEVKKLIDALLEKDPTQRIGMLAGRENDILEHVWFKDIDLKKLREKEIPAPIIPPSMIEEENK
ncbi:unnamed protein product [Cylindrotheca closterium]|uniref:cGMP-dependent protein kinase n=1 Tax=Cylindrotheca closterium TaxID=2856 RepID=A0AAD2CKJ2_9STRA|nr:unnamed protein product [Cylindrotheca closterium]